MIDNTVIESFNNRLTVDLNNIKKMTPAQLDRVKSVGSQADALLKNRDFAQFIHQFKFEKLDALCEVTGFTPEDNETRIAISHQITGIDDFIKSLWSKAKLPISRSLKAKKNPKNIMVTPDFHPIVLDFEVEHTGNPVFDLAFVLAHLLCKYLKLGLQIGRAHV